MTAKIPLAAVPVKAPPANTIAVWPKAHPLIAETKDGASHVLVDLSAFNADDIERIDISQVESLPRSIEVALAMADLEAELEAMRQETTSTKGGAFRAEARGWCVGRFHLQLVRFRGLPRDRQGTRPDPDRPLLRLLNRAGGEPVLVMCGRPGNRDPAHAAAGRLPVRFHKYSDVRLLWREFPGGFCRVPMSTSELQGFAAAIVLTNAEEPLIDLPISVVMGAVAKGGRSALWGEAAPGGSVVWHENFAIRPFVNDWGLCIDVQRLFVEAGA
jgi:hypothetical protein